MESCGGGRVWCLGWDDGWREVIRLDEPLVATCRVQCVFVCVCVCVCVWFGGGGGGSRSVYAGVCKCVYTYV